MTTKRKINTNIYNDKYNDNDSKITDRMKSKKMKHNNLDVKICDECGYGYDMLNTEKKCRCIINVYEINIGEQILKFCIFCDNHINSCECSMVIWTQYLCNNCHIEHSIFDKCNYIYNNKFLEYFNNNTDNMNYNMNYNMNNDEYNEEYNEEYNKNSKLDKYDEYDKYENLKQMEYD
jgi:hypothetical protein